MGRYIAKIEFIFDESDYPEIEINEELVREEVEESILNAIRDGGIQSYIEVTYED